MAEGRDPGTSSVELFSPADRLLVALRSRVIAISGEESVPADGEKDFVIETQVAVEAVDCFCRAKALG